MRENGLKLCITPFLVVIEFIDKQPTNAGQGLKSSLARKD